MPQAGYAARGRRNFDAIRHGPRVLADRMPGVERVEHKVGLRPRRRPSPSGPASSGRPFPAPTALGVLAGAFAGVSGGATVGVGAGANVLVGGSNRSIALQPLSIEGSTGLNIALGVAELRLQAAQ